MRRACARRSSPLADAVSARPLIARPPARPPTAPVGHGEAAPLHGYDGVTVDDVRAALEDCRALLARRPTATRARAPLLARVRPGGRPPPGGRRDRPRAVGPRGPPRRGSRCGGCSAPTRRRPVAVNATIAAAGPRRGGARGRRCRGGRVHVRQGQGRRSATTPAASPRCAPPPDPTWRSGSTPTAPGPFREALAALRMLEPVGIELCEEPVRGLDQMPRCASRDATCRSRSTRPRSRPGRSTAGRATPCA